MKKYARLLLAALLVVSLSGAPMFAQVSPVSSVNLSLNVSETLTESCTPGSIQFTYDGVNAASASGPISCTTTWNLASGHSTLEEQAYLSSPTAALAGPSNIPAADVFASVDGGAATACTSTDGGTYLAEACPDLYDVTGTVPTSGAHTDSVLLSLSGVGVLGAGSYTGVINFITVVN